MSDAAGTMVCPSCRSSVTEFCTINDRLTACAPCARRMVDQALELTPARLVAGLGLAFGAALGIGVVWGGIVYASLRSGGNLPPYGNVLSTIFMGIAAGTAAKKGSDGRGGLPFQLGAALFTVLSASYALVVPLVIVQTLKDHPDTNPAALAAVSIAAPILYVAILVKSPWFLIGPIFGVVEAFRRAPLAPLIVRGPFPAEGAPRRFPAPPPGSAAPPATEVRAVAPPPAPNARAAGLDFERPQ